MTAEADYPRQIKACRVCGTVLLLIFGIQAMWVPLKIHTYIKVFRSMVEGGAESMPPLSKFLVQNQIALLGLISLVTVGSFLGLWMSRRLSTLIYVTGGLTAFFALIYGLIDLAMYQPLVTGISKFQG